MRRFGHLRLKFPSCFGLSWHARTSLPKIGMADSATRSREEFRRFFFGDIFKDGGYKPLHPDLFAPEATSSIGRWLAPGFADAVAAVKSGSRSGLREEMPGVYSFDLFTPEFCDMIVAEVEHAQATRREDLTRPNGMNRYGLVLNQLGLEPLISALQQDHIQALQAELFPQESTGTDDHHCFIVRYSADEDVGLDMHEDDSDITLNVCLGKEFQAATLTFCGLAADDDHRKQCLTYEHAKGRAVIHLGRHRHGADNIESGERINFILWSTSSSYRNSEAYQAHRVKSASALRPDPVCLSYTHDRDYTSFLEKPSDKDAMIRGVMLDVVERRNSVYNRPVHDLSKPLQEINEVPCAILFLEGLSREDIQALFSALMQLAQSTLEGTGNSGDADSSPSAILFFVAVQPVGAIPQVRKLCGVRGSPAFAVLDVRGEKTYSLKGDINAESMKSFVDTFRRGELQGSPIGEPECDPCDEGTLDTDLLSPSGGADSEEADVQETKAQSQDCTAEGGVPDSSTPQGEAKQDSETAPSSCVVQ